jgi:hypothetical protein
MVIAGREAAPTFSASAPRPAFLYIIISNGPFDCRELSYLLQFLMIYLIPQLSKARDQKWTSSLMSYYLLSVHWHNCFC